MGKFIDLTGQTFNRLTVVSRAENSRHPSANWNCVCSCGNATVVRGDSLKSGGTRSCGCINKEFCASGNARRIDGLSVSDKAAWKRRHYDMNPEKKAKKNRQTVILIRSALKTVSKQIRDGYGNRCSCCGQTGDLFLQLDHVFGGGRQDAKSHGTLAMYRRVVSEGFPNRYQVLCANCNHAKLRNRGVCPHAGFLGWHAEDLLSGCTAGT